MLKEFLEKHKQVVLCGNVAKSSEEIKKVIKQWGYEALEQKGLEVKGEIEEMKAEKFYRICKLIGAPFTNATQKAKDFPIVWDVFLLDESSEFGGYLVKKEYEKEYDEENDCEIYIPEFVDGGMKKFFDCAEQYKDKKFVLILEGMDSESIQKVLSKMSYMLKNRDEKVIVGESAMSCAISSNVYLVATLRADESKLSEWECGVIEEIGRFEVK